MIATDSAGDNDGTLVGGAIWQPTDGRVKGALRLDGVDDYVAVPFVCDPSAGAFSVFAWVKGGPPGQVILSQEDGANWLLAAAAMGELTTELKSGRGGTPASASQARDSVASRTDYPVRASFSLDFRH